MADTTADSGNTVPGNIACMHCGYNVRGLSVQGRCPECSTPVEHSLRGDSLRYADPDWLKKVRFGIKLQLWVILAWAVVSLLTILLSLAMTSAGHLLGLTSIPLHGLFLWATFRLTTREPRVAGEEKKVTWRRAARYCSTFEFCMVVTAAVGAEIALPPELLGVTNALAIVGVVGFSGVLICLRQFAQRIPNAKLARSTTVVLWGNVSTQVCARGLFMLRALGVLGPAIFSGTRGPGIAGSLAMLGGCLLLLSAIVFGVWHVIILFSYKGAFGQALEAANRSPMDASSVDQPTT